MEHDNIHDKQDLNIYIENFERKEISSYIDPNDLQLFFQDMIYKMYVDKVIVMVHERFQDKLDFNQSKKENEIKEYLFFTK
jgi:hypothetical protein